MTDEALHCLRVHESGLLVGAGCEAGNVALLQLTEGLASAHRNDKTAVTAVRGKNTSTVYLMSSHSEGYIL